MSLISIISVHYNAPEVTIDFLKSILKNNESHSIEVILVDNASRHNHEKKFKAIYPDLIYLRSDKNLGFAGGNNLGVKSANGDFLFFLNNDTEVTPFLMTTLVAEMEQNPEIGIISPLLLYHETSQDSLGSQIKLNHSSQPSSYLESRRFDGEKRDLIQYAGFSKMNYLLARNHIIGKLELDSGQYNQDSEETSFCHGAAMMCRSEDLKVVGLMDENYFLYYEEMDWCEKFKRAGKKMWFTGKAKVYHKESISVGKQSTLKTYFLARNRMLFIRKNTSSLNTIAFGFYFYGMVSPVMMAKYVASGKIEHAKWIWKAMIWNFTQSKNSSYLGFNK